MSRLAFVVVATILAVARAYEIEPGKLKVYFQVKPEMSNEDLSLIVTSAMDDLHVGYTAISPVTKNTETGSGLYPYVIVDLSEKREQIDSQI